MSHNSSLYKFKEAILMWIGCQLLQTENKTKHLIVKKNIFQTVCQILKIRQKNLQKVILISQIKSVILIKFIYYKLYIQYIYNIIIIAMICIWIWDHVWSGRFSFKTEAQMRCSQSPWKYLLCLDRSWLALLGFKVWMHLVKINSVKLFIFFILK